MDILKQARLNALRQQKEPFTSKQWLEWSALQTERFNELAAQMERVHVRTVRRQAAPVVDMNALKYPMAERARQSMAKMRTRQAPEPDAEPGSALEWSRHHTVNIVR